MKIYLARHGETDWNRVRKMQGSTDIPLNDKGRRQAEMLRERFESIAIQVIYCSQLQRSGQTAEIIAQGRPVVRIRDLNERSLGKYEGEILDRENIEYVAEFRRRCMDPNDTLDGGESYRQHRKRIERALQEILGKHTANDEILIVGHGGTNQIILQVLLDLPMSDLGKYAQQNTDVCLIELTNGAAPAWSKW